MRFQKSDGAHYAPVGKPNPVVKPGDFVFASVHLDHGHVYGQTNGLIEAGATLKWVYDPDPLKVEKFLSTYPQAKAARSLEEILEDKEVCLVNAAAIPNLRGPLGCRVMKAGKHYFTDKTPFTTLEQLSEARATAKSTGKKYYVYYSERIHVECAVHAGELVRQGAVGRVVQTIGLGPHRLGAPDSRPEWFFKREQYGGILCDIGAHQCEQFPYYTGATDATITNASVGNYAYPQFPELEDFGDANLIGNNGATGYYRVDWLTPQGLRSWGDGRYIILGTKGYIELRKYTDPTTSNGSDQLILVDEKGEQRIPVAGQVGFPFFGKFILDCLNGTEYSMTQEHVFKAAELCLLCQQKARNLTPQTLKG